MVLWQIANVKLDLQSTVYPPPPLFPHIIIKLIV